MKLLLCVISLCKISIFFNFARADDDDQDAFDNLRKTECSLMSLRCQYQTVEKVTEEEIMGLCDAKPLTTATSKCMVKCQMQQYNWITDNGFQKANYLDYIKSLGNDEAYVEAAEKVVDLCKDKTSPADAEDRCDTAFIIMNCLQDEGDKLQQLNLGYNIFYVPPFVINKEDTSESAEADEITTMANNVTESDR